MRRLLLTIVSSGLLVVTLMFMSTGTALAANTSVVQSGSQTKLPPQLDPATYKHLLPDAATIRALTQAKASHYPQSRFHASYLAPTSYPVLFIHGFNNTSAVDCSNTWNNAKNYLRGHGWTGSLTTLQFYTKDTHCDDSLRNEASHCTGYNDSGSNDGTNNEDIRHVACEFAWYVWDHYTQYGQNVQVIAHSMGGLITRWAIYATPFEAALPPYLLIQDTVTLGTPHYGAPPTFAFFYCGSCLQGGQMETGMPFMQELINNGQNPQAQNGTDWTMIGSSCDIVNTLNSDSSEWMTSGHKVLYQSPCYSHGDYMGDVSDNMDATVNYCDFCGLPPVNYATNKQAAHAIHDATLAIESSQF